MSGTQSIAMVEKDEINQKQPFSAPEWKSQAAPNALPVLKSTNRRGNKEMIDKTASFGLLYTITMVGQQPSASLRPQPRWAANYRTMLALHMKHVGVDLIPKVENDADVLYIIVRQEEAGKFSSFSPLI